MTTPGSRCCGASFLSKDNSKLFLFGGLGTDMAGDEGPLGDLWIYHVANASWTYQSGPKLKDASSIYDYQNGVTTPGSRAYPSFCTNINGRKFLFGGESAGPIFYGDMWELSDETYILSHIGGKNGTNFGYTNTHISARSGSLSLVQNDTIYIFGGFGYNNDDSSIGTLNDLWTFDITTKDFTYLIGHRGVNDDSGNYTMKPYNPLGRFGAQGWWVNEKIFLMFSGAYRNSNNYDDFDLLNDLWKYNITANAWGLIAGGKQLNVPAFPGWVSGMNGYNIFEHSTILDEPDKGDQFLFFGGFHLTTDDNIFDATNVVYLFTHNYDTNASAFTKCEENIQFAPIQYPSPRAFSFSWKIPSSDVLYIYGGKNGSFHVAFDPEYYNDLWKYEWAQPVDYLYDILLIVFLVVVPFTFFFILVIVFAVKAVYDMVKSKKQKKIAPGGIGGKKSGGKNEKELQEVSGDA